MEKENYLKLYRLQDKVLDLFFTIEHSFYLTGGTALNRFYKEVRYSEDLDFFSNDSINFDMDMDNIIELFENRDIKFDLNVRSRDFFRIFVFENDVKLKIDFVNDRVKHIKRLSEKNGIVLDNLENIFANKITALIGRDEAKDVVDIWSFYRFFKFDFKEIVGFAREKMFFNYEDLVYRLYTFPLDWVDEVDFVSSNYKELFLEEYKKMCENFEKEIKEVEV